MTNSDSFVHLHVHTEYSLLDGASRLADLVAAAAADGQPALGITDHGNMYGVIEFYKTCLDYGVKPIIGTEAYMAHEHRSERPVRRGKIDDTGGNTEMGSKLYYHLTLLAENEVGYKNLIQVASRAFLEGYYYKPRVDWEVLSAHSEGLIATTGCLGSHVNQALMQGSYKAAEELAGKFRDIFGPENYYVELQDHGIPAQQDNLQQLLDISKRLGLPLLATNDTHYTEQHDSVSHDVLLCVQTGALVSDTNRLKFHGHEHYLKTARQMRSLFAELPQACDSTLEIAERANLQIEFGSPQLPEFPLPEGHGSPDDYLCELTLQGAKAHWGDPLPEDIASRLSYELKIIENMGFSSYFLIVWDLVKHAKRSNIRVGPGRGSAAGSAVSYSLGITDLDPIKYDLLFERFLNPGRRQMPDIDIDFDSRYRDNLINYLSDRYGRDQVAQIITFARIKARQAVRDAARVLDFPYSLGDRVAKAIPGLILGRDTPLHACLEKTPGYESGYERAKDLRELHRTDEDAREVIEAARGLEGLCRQDSIHAAAVVLTRDPITSYMPIQRKPGNGDSPEHAPVVTQYEMGAVEELGLLKMDLLGLRNLDVITDTLGLIARTQGTEIAIEDVPLDDPKTYALLQQGDTTGVFQLESGPMRALMQNLRPTSFDDIAALVALYRPGPMEAKMPQDYADRKNGRRQVEYLHPDAEEILSDTYGLMIYQESMMRIAQKFAGFSLEEADNLRKACGKKIREIMAAEQEKFISGCEATGYGTALGRQWWEIIEPFADYAFNKSHSYSYALLAYQTAWLKANYPVQFMAALLTGSKSDQDRQRTFLAECRQRNIEVRLPDINTSELDFAVVDGPDGSQAITFGLSAIRNIGQSYTEKLLEEREPAGGYRDFYDFVERAPRLCLAKNSIESLIKSGCFDSLGHRRESLLASYEEIVDAILSARDRKEQGLVSMFADSGQDVRPAMAQAEPNLRKRLQDEREMLGLYISHHPLDDFEHYLGARAERSLGELGEVADRSTVTVCGILSKIQFRSTRNGSTMMTAVLEDYDGTVELVGFAKAVAKYENALQEEKVVAVKGRVDKSRDSLQLIVEDVEVLKPPTWPVTVKCEEHKICEGSLLEEVFDVLRVWPGEHKLRFEFGGGKVLDVDFQISKEHEVIDYLEQTFGDTAVEVRQTV